MVKKGSRYMKWIWLFAVDIALISNFLAVAHASGFCAVTVVVTDHRGTRLNSIPVELHDSHNVVIARTETSNGIATFCDFGFGEHSIAVGGDSMGSVVVRRVKAVYGYDQKLTVVLNSMVSERALIGSPTRICSLYLRVSSENGDPVGGAQVSVVGSPMSVLTDSYGRAFFGIAAQQKSTIRIMAPNRNAETFDVICHELEEIERPVVLHAK